MWPFKRKSEPPIDRRNMNEDWAPGDVAECIRDDWIRRDNNDPKIGDVLRVTAIDDYVGKFDNVRCYFLGFAGKLHGYECTGFRKLRPAEAEWTERLKRRRAAPKELERVP